ncbi:carcinoembryonic antigen-related cell adhesion molecule 2-like isoform X1 [Alligator sinensis]|uniref:Carcinoembryonic antigen-related cell adhesion molecule 2-like isoform X1 n=1 Tax=Alligator sinensis TaxID=38654 RepID=A0A3Q0FRV2_ALLSI|nr:carcinoembryonic antigen-related cell adhesion molecule 2-like isoform X1 [Alligator sinensis]
MGCCPNPMVVENRTLELTCEAPPSTETLLWDHDGSVLVPGGRVGLSPGNRTLTVQGVCRDDAEMLSQPKVISSNFTVVENRTLKLTCEAPPSTETLLWDRDGSVLVPGGRVELSPGNRTLMVPGVGRDDAGNYTCEVRNPINSVRSEGVIVTVIYGPVTAHIAPPGPLHPLLGDNVTLTCAADSFPAPRFHWSHNGSDLVPALTSAVLSLVLRGVEQTGVFECLATNPHTGRSATTSVSVTLGPGQQADPSLSAGAVAGITLAAAALGGALAYVLFQHCRRKKTPQGSKDPPPVYENVNPPACVGAAAQPGSSPDPTYQTLQPGTRDLYQELRT